MNISDRIQKLRKERGISQDTLAGEIGVSRQAVSKWESEQSLPELEKIIALSEYFGVSTDYLIKGITEGKRDSINLILSKVLYIVSTFFITLGVISGFASWYENQNMEGILGSFIIQFVGITSYFIGTVLSSSKAVFIIKWLNTIMVVFMPLSLILTLIFNRVPAPYPIGLFGILVFITIYIPLSIVIYYLLKKSSQANGSK